MDAPVKKDDIARMRPLERKALLEEIGGMVARGELRLGEAARLLRSGVLGLDRATFARAVHVSERAIAKLEDDPDVNPTLETLTRVFAPFGAKVGLVFPGMEEASPPSEEAVRRREALKEAVARTRRRRRSAASR